MSCYQTNTIPMIECWLGEDLNMTSIGFIIGASVLDDQVEGHSTEANLIAELGNYHKISRWTIRASRHCAVRPFWLEWL